MHFADKGISFGKIKSLAQALYIAKMCQAQIRIYLLNISITIGLSKQICYAMPFHAKPCYVILTP